MHYIFQLNVLKLIACCCLIVLVRPAHADQRCFMSAESYYEQIYCQIKAEGKGRKLPSLTDFKRNNEQVQALLLKRLAEGLGIAMVMPTSRVVKSPSAAKFTVDVIVQENLPGCNRKGDRFQCSQGEYSLVGNKSNDGLSEAVLSTENRMLLPEYKGILSNSKQVAEYLQESYKHYLLKMIDIGLGGATLSYGKFAFLFDDLSRRGVKMSDRFETMYHYLKIDKRSMAVPSKSVVPQELKAEDCFSLEPLLVCYVARQNWLFLRG